MLIARMQRISFVRVRTRVMVRVNSNEPHNSCERNLRGWGHSVQSELPPAYSSYSNQTDWNLTNYIGLQLQ